MMYASLIALVGVGILSVSCRPRTFQETGTNVSSASTNNANSINPRAYNAFQMWQGTQTDARPAPLPPSFWNFKNSFDPNVDGAFYVAGEDFYEGGDLQSWTKFNAKPTSGITMVNNDTLVYPANNGKELRIRFLPVAGDKMALQDAAGYCERMDNRLPTARELFDFCTVGISGPNYGNGFKLEEYQKTGGRCAELWSISLYAPQRDRAWHFGLMGYLSAIDRTWKQGVRCVETSKHPRIRTEWHGAD